MTCIVGIEHDEKVYLASDSISISGYDKNTIIEPKCFRNIHNENFIFGYTTSFRFGQLLQYTFNPPSKLDSHKSDMHFLCTSFIDSIRSVMKNGGFLNVTNQSVEESGLCLFGYNKKLYRLDVDFQIQPINYGAVGGGHVSANAVLTYLKDSDIDPQDKLLAALTTASEVNACVIPPFHFITL